MKEASQISSVSLLSLSERRHIAGEIFYARDKEKSALRTYNVFRGAAEYVRNLCGLQAFFDNVPEGRPILDVGAGRGYAAEEFADVAFSHERRFIGTALRFNRSLVNAFGEGNFHITSAEVLRGVEDESIGGILGVYSAPAYSVNHAQVARRFNEVLVPGGIIKVSLFLTSPSRTNFMHELNDLGYDVMAQRVDKRIIVVAIKPGGEKKISALQLLTKDNQTRTSQEHQVGMATLSNHFRRTLGRGLLRFVG